MEAKRIIELDETDITEVSFILKERGTSLKAHVTMRTAQLSSPLVNIRSVDDGDEIEVKISRVKIKYIIPGLGDRVLETCVCNTKVEIFIQKGKEKILEILNPKFYHGIEINNKVITIKPYRLTSLVTKFGSVIC